MKHHWALAACHTQRQTADVLTKPFINGELWPKVCRLIGIVADKFFLMKVEGAERLTG